MIFCRNAGDWPAFRREQPAFPREIHDIILSIQPHGNDLAVSKHPKRLRAGKNIYV